MVTGNGAAEILANRPQCATAHRHPGPTPGVLRVLPRVGGVRVKQAHPTSLAPENHKG
jgi:hypothetical protein